MLIIKKQNNTNLTNKPQNNSNQLQLIIKNQNTNTYNKSTQYKLNVNSLNNNNININTIPIIKINKNISTNNIININNTLNSQPNPYNKSKKFNTKTNTTLNKNLIKPPNINKINIKPISKIIPKKKNINIKFINKNIHIPHNNNKNNKLN